MHIQIDQSGKIEDTIEDTTVDTVLAFSNSKNKTTQAFVE